MARIKDSSVEAVKSAAEILPLVEDYVRLRKAGGTYKGLCPFHQERTPSFTVTPARGTYKCCGCGEGGDAISFVEKLEQVDFVGAIESLAKRFGVAIEYEEISPEAERERRRKDRLGQLLERATAFYERTLWSSEQGAFARAYLESRGLGEEVCRAFRLGYAPGGDTLARGAQKEGFTRDDLLATGLANTRGNDYFQGRLLLPLPKGSDPADDPAVFQERLAAPVSYLVHRVRLLNDRATDKQAAFAAVKLFLNDQPDSPEHLDARQLATDLLGLPPETQATLAPASNRSRSAGVISPRLLEAGHRLEWSALGGAAVHPSLNRYLEKLSPEH